MFKLIESPSLSALGLSGALKSSQFQASSGDYMSVLDNDIIHFITPIPPAVLSKIPNKVDQAIAHPSQRGIVIIRKDNSIQQMDSVNKQLIASATIPACGSILLIKYIDDILHVVSTQQLIRFSQDLQKQQVVCSTSDFFGEQQIITSFTGVASSNAYAISALVGGKPKTLIYNNQKVSVVPDMLCSAMCMFSNDIFLTTSPANSLKISTVNLTKMKPGKTEFATEAPEVVKSIVQLPKLGLTVLFTSQQRILVIDLQANQIGEFKSAQPVAIAAASNNGLVFVQTDAKVISMQPELQLLVSQLQNKLKPAEQYDLFIKTDLFNNQVLFAKICKNYLEECFQQQNYQEIARIVADSAHYKAELRNQQLIDKITLSDRKAFLVFASALVQTYGLKLNQLETLTLIRLLHQEGMIATAFPKFLDNNYIEITPGEEQTGLLIIDLAGQPVSQEYAKLALQCFMKFECHNKVVQFFLKNENLAAGLEYLARLPQKVEYDLVGFMENKYPSVETLKGDQKFTAQQDAQLLLQSEALNLKQKEQIITKFMIKLEQGQMAVQYITQYMQKNNTAEVQTLFIKILFLTAGANMAKIKGNLFIGIKGPLKLANIEDIILFCVEQQLFDVAVILSVQFNILKKIESQVQVTDCQQFVEITEKAEIQNIKASSEIIKFLSELINKESLDSTVFCISKLIMSLPNYQENLEAQTFENRLDLEIKKKVNFTEDLFDELFEQIIIKQREKSSPLLNITAIFELLVKCKFTTTILSSKLEGKEITSDLQKEMVAELFSFIVAVEHCYKKCQTCDEKKLDSIAGETIYNNQACIEEYLQQSGKYCSIKQSSMSLIQKIGFPTETQLKDKFNRLGNYSIIYNLIVILIDKKEFSLLNEIFEDISLQLSQVQLIYILKHLSKISDQNNLKNICSLMMIVAKNCKHNIVKNTYSVIEGVLQVASGSIGESIPTDFNALDTDAVIDSLKLLEEMLLKDKELIIAPATKVIESLSVVPSQQAQEYMVQFTKKALDQTNTSAILLKQLVQNIVKKQDTQFWTNAIEQIPQIVNIVGDMGVAISSIEVLSFAQACIDIKGVDYKHVKDVLKEQIPLTTDKKFSQNLLLQLDVKISDEDQMIIDINQYKEAVTLTVAGIAVEHKLFKAAAVIFKLLNNHVDAVSCLLNNNLVDEAEAYAKEVKDSNAWRTICKYFLTIDTQRAYEALKQTNQLQLSTELAHVVLKEEKIDLKFILSQYMLSHRLTEQDKYIDSDLALLLAHCMHAGSNADTTKQQLVTLLGDQSTTINAQKLGDQCYIKEMFIPARFFYAAARNYAAMNSVCLKVGDYLGALQAAARLNMKDVWVQLRNELIQQVIGEEIDYGKMLYLYVAQCNVLQSGDDLLQASKLPLEIKIVVFRIMCEIKQANSNFSNDNQQLINQTLSEITRVTMQDYDLEKESGFISVKKLLLNDVNDQIFNIMAGVLAQDQPQDLLNYMKKYAKLINMEFVLKQCQKYELNECITFCYCALGQGDDAAKNIIESDGNLDQLLKLLQVTQQRPTHALAYKFILEKHDDNLERFLNILILTPVELMQIATLVENSASKLFSPLFQSKVLNSEQPLDLLEVNQVFLKYMIDNKMEAELLLSINKVNNYDKADIAIKLEPVFKYISALIYNQIGQHVKCCQMLIEEKMIEKAVEQVKKVNSRPAAKVLLEYASESGSDLIMVMEATNPILRLDEFMSVVWKNGKMEQAMPYIIMGVGKICDKVESQ
ncbi:Putative_clathrin heavy chain protein [Hexamita inflata]|uniref:Clathrin heavy chain n=1 Tax=Hexamita inflata TaxID=28002 RepID=A0AA86Q9W3_9EUKA|nr:Putative clathrin heavy chain protein [Hexamita inflata]